MPEPEPLEYASPPAARLSPGRRHAVVAACCFGGSWLAWLLLYKASTFPDGFSDEVFNWGEAVAVMALPGTLCGLVLYALAVVAMHAYASQRRSGGAS